VPLQLGHGEEILQPHLVDREFVGEGAWHLLPCEAEDRSGGGAEIEGIDDQEAVHPFEEGEEVETEGAAVHHPHSASFRVAIGELLGEAGAETVVAHQQVAESQDQGCHHRSRGSMYL